MRDEIIGFIRAHNSFVITSHSRPDGDSIGSQLGLALALESIGKSALIVNADPLPQVYSFLPGSEKIRFSDRIEGRYDGVFVLECNDLDRPKLKKLEGYYIVNIDHHPKTKPFGHLNWVDHSAAAVGEMIYELIKSLHISLTVGIATALYVAILTDTGSFQFSNTRAQSFTIASDLVALGADPSQIAQVVYMTQSVPRLRLLSQVLDTLELHHSGKIAWIRLTQQALKQAGASFTDTEGIVNHPLSLAGVSIVAFFREEAIRLYRISLRSKDHYNVGTVAEHFGGGGHEKAAGLCVQGDFPDVRERVLAELEKLLDHEGTG